MEIVKVEEIRKTTNYNQFKLCDWNRPVTIKGLRRIERSVRQKGWLIHPITVNEKMEVMDGQHRLAYAKAHNLPVYYQVLQGAGPDDCIAMNNARTRWSLPDYINFYAQRGNNNYVILKMFIEQYPFITPQTLAAVIKGYGASGGNYTGAIKEGAFTLTQEEYKNARELLSYLEKCSTAVASIEGRTSSIYGAIAFAYGMPEVDNDRLLKQIREQAGIVIPPANLDMALKEIERIYNYNIRRKNIVYIYTEYKKQATARMLHQKEEKN